MNECPGCGSPPMALSIPLDGQAFCPNEDCHVLMWNPNESLEQAFATVTYVDLSDLDTL
jgi:hypothetical protein